MQKNITRTLLVASCMLALLAGCTKNDEYAQLQARVQTQDQQLRQLQPNMADSWAQVQALRQEINMLKGQMDELNRAGVVGKVKTHDAALRQVEKALSLNFNLDQPVESSSSSFTPGTPTGMSATPTPRPMAPSASVATAPAADAATQLFNQGISAFNSRQYSQAQASFVSFTEKYPDNSQVGNAWYYVGDCSFQLNKFNDAAIAYDKVITSYPRSTRAPAAYLKQAICFSKLGQKAAATARMQELMKKYPTSAEAARAKSFLQTNK